MALFFGMILYIFKPAKSLLSLNRQVLNVVANKFPGFYSE